eukprot:CAMPEP_0197291244 /NCGR_PEP_ID=MMETSP0890-20130614/11774_1 /TAXON_ID=44058 ORGANISM="Aureoumbra lagunensis, Strain CCMP1510" /NCGR_SAMPLE_ID=MMETSP0890 /ASSEMBLY_ACC=CAM_ASM_000533 /LENGTH=305 /DNA_ID=CAMNT_0042763895 /DNA_START=245 /DNA_END=1162 /DNA_ORIENTATION=-
MGDYAESYNAEFVLGIGDNMYDTGVSSVDDPQFKSKFEDTFTADSLQVPWYIASGNHDYYGNISAQVAYTEKSDRWTFPDLYYKEEIKKDDIFLTLIAIDTWRLNGGDTYVAFDPKHNRGHIRDLERLQRDHENGIVTPGTYESITMNYQPAHLADFLVPELADDPDQLSQIESWLKEANDNNSTWIIVQGHFPCYSSTTDEHGDTKSLIKNLVPLLEKYNVSVYFSGHDHVLQHISKSGVNFLGSGAGARKHDGINESYDGLVHADQSKYGFMAHKLTTTKFETVFVVSDDGKAKETYNFTIYK